MQFTATETSEIAACRAPSDKPLEPRLVRPEDCGFEIRGGGNATRQILDTELAEMGVANHVLKSITHRYITAGASEASLKRTTTIEISRPRLHS